MIRWCKLRCNVNIWLYWFIYLGLHGSFINWICVVSLWIYFAFVFKVESSILFEELIYSFEAFYNVDKKVYVFFLTTLLFLYIISIMYRFTKKNYEEIPQAKFLFPIGDYTKLFLFFQAKKLFLLISSCLQYVYGSVAWNIDKF